MKYLYLILCFFVSGLGGLAATRTASVSGDWNDPATWGGAAIPTAVDAVNSNGDVVLTVPLGYTATCLTYNIGNTNNSTGTAELIVNGTFNPTDNGFIGKGAGKDAILTMGPDSEINIPTGKTLFFNNSKFRTTVTQLDHMAKITGGGNINSASGVTGPAQDWQPFGVSFQNTSTISIVGQATTGVFTSTILPVHCTFQCAGITLGAVDTPNSVPVQAQYSDFRNIGGTNTVTVRRLPGGSAAYGFYHCTAASTGTAIKLLATTSDGMTVDSSVLYHVIVNQTSQPVGINYTNNLAALNTAAGNSVILSDAASVGSTVDRNYFVQTANNAHPVATAGTGGSGTHNITDNVLDGLVDGSWIDKPDLLIPGATPLAILLKSNLLFSTGEMFVGVSHPNFVNGIVCRNNTIAGTISAAITDSGHMFTPEGTPNAGSISIRNNLHLGNGKAGENSIAGSSSGGDQVISYSDYNNFYNVTIPYSGGTDPTITAGNTGKTVPGGNDTAHDPQFLDPSRNLAKWNALFGSGVETTAAAIDYFLGLNRYRGTPYFDQGGTPIVSTLAQARDWVRAGYAPRNQALKGAGDPADGSPDIGAIPVYTVRGINTQAPVNSRVQAIR